MTSLYEDGNPKAPILFLAEAPSFLEQRMNKPLVGPSGEVFNDCLHQAGLVRHNSYILNVWEFQVSKDVAGNIYQRLPSGLGPLLFHDKKGFTAIGLEYAQNTLRRIRQSECNTIIAMGKPAMSLCTGDVRSIIKWRGSIIEGVERVGKKRVVITFHPAATLHGVYTWRYLIIADFQKAQATMGKPNMGIDPRKLIIGPSFSDIVEYLNIGKTKERLATDLEVINHQTSCFCMCYDPVEVMTIPIGDEFGNPLWSEVQEIQIWKLYAELMGDPNIDKINQNLIGFDVPFLLQQNNIYTRGFLGDTMIAQKIMYPDFKKGLDFICSIRTNEPYYKDEGKMWKGMGGDIEQFWRYCAKDGSVALEAWNDMEEEMTTDGYWPTYNMVARLSNPLQYMTLRGMRVDHDRLHSTHERISAELLVKENELNEVAEVPFNPGSPKQCQQYFYGLKGITPYKNGAGGITTDDKAMARIYRRFNLPEAKLVQEIRALRKLKGTYLEVAFDKDGRLRCSWDPTGTWTGRLSSSQTVFDTGMNMQNLHPEFKHFLVADYD